MKRGWLVCILLSVLVIPLSSGEIYLTQPNTIYNVGDELAITITVQPISATNDFLEVELICTDGSVSLYRNPLNVAAGQQRTVPISVVLDATVISGSRGSCTLEATHGSDAASSQTFDITNEITLDADFDPRRLDPGQAVTITGTATKPNGATVTGFIQVTLDEAGIDHTESITQGAFSFTITLPENAPPGDHELVLRGFEKDAQGEVNNEGFFYEQITLNQVFKELNIEIASQNVVPGSSLPFTVYMYDQTNSEMTGEVSLLVYQPNGKVLLKKLVPSGEEQLLEITGDDEPGYWKLETQFGDIVRRKLFYVEEQAGALFSVIGDTLIVTNTGNVVYDKAVQVSIGSGSEIVPIHIPLGESEEFRLSAPNGEYEIRINDGIEEQVLGRVALTGNAIGIGEISSLSELATSPAGWVLGGIVFLLLIVLVYSNMLKRKLRRTSRAGAPILVKTSASSIAPPPSIPGEVNSGAIEEAVIIAVHLRSALTPLTSNVVNSALTTMKRSGANIYVDGAFRIIVFSPMLTKQADSPLLAVQLAHEFTRALNGHNAKFKDRVEYGVGINNGPIISEMNQGKFTFTSRGSIIPLAKRLAGTSNGEVLLSDGIRKKVMGTVKTQQVGDGWRVSEIVDRSKHSAFTQKFERKATSAQDEQFSQ